MKAYLAEKYMSGPKADAILSKVNPPKKKKRKATAASASTSFIKDDDLTGWGNVPKDGDEDEDMADAVVAEDRRFKKRQRTDADSGFVNASRTSSTVNCISSSSISVAKLYRLVSSTPKRPCVRRWMQAARACRS